MIMHELKTELITFVNWACQCPLCASSPILENIVRRVTSTGCTVRAKIIRLTMPCWMWVLWLSWGGRTVLSQFGPVVPSSPIIATVIFKIVPASNETRTKQERSFVLLPCCASKRCLLSCMVGLTQLTTPREWSTIRITDPVGVKG